MTEFDSFICLQQVEFILMAFETLSCIGDDETGNFGRLKLHI